jgi:hypothetical protein
VNPAQVLSVEKLTPTAVIGVDPAQLPPDGLLAMMLFLNVAVPSFCMPPPCWLAELPEMVLLVTVSVLAELFMPPPCWLAELPEMVLLVTVSVLAKLFMPPPCWLAELPECCC